MVGDADAVGWRLLQHALHPFQAVGVVTAQQSHPGPVEANQYVDHGRNLVLVAGNCAEKGRIEVLVAQHLIGCFIRDLEVKGIFVVIVLVSVVISVVIVPYITYTTYYILHPNIYFSSLTSVEQLFKLMLMIKKIKKMDQLPIKLFFLYIKIFFDPSGFGFLLNRRLVSCQSADFRTF